jgi:MraZ protein
MAIPAKFRKLLDVCCDGRLVVTIDHAERCLQMYPLAGWEEVEKKLVSLPSLDPKVRQLKRMLLGNATECEMDSHGRILLPPKLREFADLEKESVMSGQGNKFEIWNEKAWNSLMDESVELGFVGDLSSALESLSI